MIGKKIKLRELKIEDKIEMTKFWNNEKFMNFNGRTKKLTSTEIEELIIKSWKKRELGKEYMYAIIYLQNELIIGYITLKIVNITSKRTSFSIGIFNPEYRNKGIGTEAIRLIMNYAFNELKMHSLQLNVFEDNLRAISVYKKLGFKYTGMRRHTDFVNGKYVKDLLFDILEEEYEKL